MASSCWEFTRSHFLTSRRDCCIHSLPSPDLSLSVSNGDLAKEKINEKHSNRTCNVSSGAGPDGATFLCLVIKPGTKFELFNYGDAKQQLVYDDVNAKAKSLPQALCGKLPDLSAFFKECQGLPRSLSKLPAPLSAIALPLAEAAVATSSPHAVLCWSFISSPQLSFSSASPRSRAAFASPRMFANN